MHTSCRCLAAVCIFIAPFVPLAGAATNDPVQIPPRSILTNAPQNPFRNRALQPPAPGTVVLPQSPQAATNFVAWHSLTGNAADSHGAVGTDSVMTMVNAGC